jgi:hypothetical protein
MNWVPVGWVFGGEVSGVVLSSLFAAAKQQMQPTQARFRKAHMPQCDFILCGGDFKER